ncbi:hypothetical protein GWK47_009663 [Chionoecetes opilio]|uniref:Cadherin Y-type LIR-motif domain-containing protein n=1 Tax=Chionoecetes opilio TaxID=41210 RepID=A0A8J4Y558_CHIOP|nr:hypothetical protein GWK47_009663 [Chionoecetes opilio]
MRRGITDAKNTAVDCTGQVSTSCGNTPNFLELQLLKPLRANGQPAWARNPNIADVDVLQVDAITPASSGEELNVECGRASPPPSRGSSCQAAAGRKASKGGPGCTPPVGDDLRNYAYEGDGSSPGSLSSCKC